MIEIVPHSENDKIMALKFSNQSLNLEIEVNSHTVQNINDSKNIGTILEKYRGLLDDEAENFFINNQTIIDDFVKSLTRAFPTFIPDFVTSFLPENLNRRRILETLKEKNIDSNKIDYSNCFFKIDPSKSIKKDNLTIDDFILNLDSKKCFKNILIIDDVIDEGKTVEIFLTKMIENGNLDSDPKVKLICLYNRPKTKKLGNPLDFLRKNNSSNH